VQLRSTKTGHCHRNHQRLPLSSLLETVKINGGVECRCVWKTRDSRRISGRSLLNAHAWSPLDDRLSLSREPTTTMTTPRTHNKRCLLEWHGHAWVNDCIWRKSPKLVEDKLSKKTFFAPYIWRTLKISPSKVKKPTYGTELSTIV